MLIYKICNSVVKIYSCTVLHIKDTICVFRVFCYVEVSTGRKYQVVYFQVNYMAK